jgi:hypothetical protein
LNITIDKYKKKDESMNCTKIIIIACLSMGISSSMTFGLETSSTRLTNLSQNQFSSFYQGIINSFIGILKIPQSIATTVSEWNDKTKIIISTTIIAGLLTICQRKEIAEWISDLIVPPTEKTKKQRNQITELRWDKNYEKKAAEFLKK